MFSDAYLDDLLEQFSRKDISPRRIQPGSFEARASEAIRKGWVKTRDELRSYLQSDFKARQSTPIPTETQLVKLEEEQRNADLAASMAPTRLEGPQTPAESMRPKPSRQGATIAKPTTPKPIITPAPTKQAKAQEVNEHKTVPWKEPTREPTPQARFTSEDRLAPGDSGASWFADIDTSRADENAEAINLARDRQPTVVPQNTTPRAPTVAPPAREPMPSVETTAPEPTRVQPPVDQRPAHQPHWIHGMAKRMVQSSNPLAHSLIYGDRSSRGKRPVLEGESRPSRDGLEQAIKELRDAIKELKELKDNDDKPTKNVQDRAVKVGRKGRAGGGAQPVSMSPGAATAAALATVGINSLGAFLQGMSS